MTTEFTITVTPPLGITADGTKEVFDGGFPHKFHKEIFVGPRKYKVDNQEKSFGHDSVAFTFRVQTAELKAICVDIASDIFRFHPFKSGLEILVQGDKHVSVIALSGIDVKQLSERIFDIVKP
ncbi:MAG: hypothetical protein WCI11_07800 [Candidatus Methylumidiphilus sp.]|nr:hypothetical protein [Pseudomonadota bacterium]